MKPTNRNLSQPNYSLLVSTTTSLGKVRGFSIELLFLLSEGGLRCCDISERTGKSQPYVHRYLRNLRSYGLVAKDGVFWQLTNLGIEFVNYLSFLNINILEYRKKIERKKKVNRNKLETKAPKVSKQVPISLWTQNCDRDRVEREVVELLLKHYNKTNSKFILVKDEYELSERLKASPEAVKEALKNLRQDNIIYLRRSQIAGYWKLGLKQAFIEALLQSNMENQNENR